MNPLGKGRLDRRHRESPSDQDTAATVGSGMRPVLLLLPLSTPKLI